MVTVLPALPLQNYFLNMDLKMLLFVVFTESFQKILKTLTGHRRKWLKLQTFQVKTVFWLKSADIFIGVSAPNIVSEEMVASMNKDAILFAMANPTPEIMPDLAKKAGARVVGTGRSDFPNQVNNVVAFPGIFKGALEGRAKQITEEMKLAAAHAIASLVPDSELNEDNILPEAFNPDVADVVSKAVKDNIK